MTERDYHPTDLLPELALGVLPEAEASALRVHVASCDACRLEFDEMARVAALLPLAAEEMAPSPELKANILERIGGQAPANVVSFTEAAARRKRTLGWYGAVAAAAAAFLVVGMVAGNAIGGGGDRSLEERAAAQAEVVESAARGDLRVTRAVSSGMRVAFARAPGADQGFALVEGFPVLPEGKRYQAWFTRDGKTMEPSVTFGPGDGAWLPAAGSIDGYAAIGFTIEDEDGVEAPTQAPFMVVDLSRSVRLR